MVLLLLHLFYFLSHLKGVFIGLSQLLYEVRPEVVHLVSGPAHDLVLGENGSHVAKQIQNVEKEKRQGGGLEYARVGGHGSRWE